MEDMAPWKTLEPITLIVLRALKYLSSLGVEQIGSFAVGYARR